MSIKSICGKLFDWAGLANVPAVVKALAGLKGSAGQILEISGTDSQGVATALQAVDKPAGDGGTVPTKVSAFENDAGYVDEARVNELLAAFPTFEIQVVAQLPAEGADKTIYLVPFADDSGSYLEYLYVNGAWEVIGSRSGENVTDYTSLTNKPRINGVELEGNKTAEELGIGQPTDEQISGAVSDYLDAHPEATSTVGVRSIGEEKVKFGAVHSLLLDANLRRQLPNSQQLELHTANCFGTYTQGKFGEDGTIDTTAAGKISGHIPCWPREELLFNKTLTSKVSFYDAAGVFVSLLSVTAGVYAYTTPDNAYSYRMQNDYSNGTLALVPVRNKEIDRIDSFADLILGPVKARPKVCITGDSNTYGYGLTSLDKSWANLFIAQLGTITTMPYSPYSRWVRSSGALAYSNGTNFKTGSYMEIVTDSESVTLNMVNSYSSAWAWYIDGETDAANDSVQTIALDGNRHTVRAVFTSGQAVSPTLSIAKAIECINRAVTGASVSNVEFESGCDWAVVMIGTNGRTSIPGCLPSAVAEYSGKGTYVVPIPTHLTEAHHTHSLFQTIPKTTELFADMGYDVINCVPELSGTFSDLTYLQKDKIHFSEAGHIIICNAVSAKLGLPTYLTISE